MNEYNIGALIIGSSILISCILSIILTRDKKEIEK